MDINQKGEHFFFPASQILGGETVSNTATYDFTSSHVILNKSSVLFWKVEPKKNDFPTN